LYPNRLSLFLARPFRLIDFLFAPLVALVAWFSRTLLRWAGSKKLTGNLFGNRDELRFLMQESSHDLTSEEKNMINRVLDLQTLTVRQITVPLDKAITITAQTPLREVLELGGKSRLTRLPVWKKENGRERIIGVISLKTVLYLEEVNLEKTAGDYVKPALFLDEHLRDEEALRRMQRSGQRLAIVLGNDQREIGLLSLQDILKSIFGEVSL
ncbi:MAG: CBS domain-containing protein, partial [Limisphaerales bacterium]